MHARRQQTRHTPQQLIPLEKSHSSAWHHATGVSHSRAATAHDRMEAAGVLQGIRASSVDPLLVESEANTSLSSRISWTGQRAHTQESIESQAASVENSWGGGVHAPGGGRGYDGLDRPARTRRKQALDGKVPSGAQFTCFTGTKVQMLTPGGAGRPAFPSRAAA